MRWLNVDTVRLVHQEIIAVTGGLAGVRSESLLESALMAPLATFDGKDLYPDLLTKVAVLLRGLVKNHPFVDGNKRTAFVTAVLTLKLNGLEFNATQEEVVVFMEAVAIGALSLKAIMEWIRRRVV